MPLATDPTESPTDRQSSHFELAVKKRPDLHSNCSESLLYLGRFDSLRTCVSVRRYELLTKLCGKIAPGRRKGGAGREESDHEEFNTPFEGVLEQY